MIAERLFGKFQMKTIRQNKIYLWPCFLLLIFHTGCAVTPEQAREREVLRQIDKVIEWELSREDKSQKKDQVLVALYLDTEEIENPAKMAEYRCYSFGRGGYSGVERIPYGTPWLRWERIRSNNLRKEIIIDPGPPYKNVTKIVNLIPGEVANLGRIVLEKVEAEGTASISGIVKDENAEPLEGVEISSTKGVVTTDSKGYYRIDGFGLEVVDLKVAKNGYIPAKAEVSIRNMDNRDIEKNFVLSFPRKVGLRYMISPAEIDDFNSPQATGGAATFFVDEKYFPIPVAQIRSNNFRRFIDKVHLNFRINNGKLTLDNSYAPIFYERLLSSFSKEFEAINSVGPLNYNAQCCPEIQEGDIILINGGKVSNYTVKILFEEIQPVLP